jgi:predicted O-methyltransferase YrrM
LGRRYNRHLKPSVIIAPDSSSQQSQLIEIALKAVTFAMGNRIKESPSMPNDGRRYNIYPGEHYRLLAALVKVLEPSHIVEIGTHTGMGTKALLAGSQTATITTYDLIPWVKFDSHLDRDNFDSGRVFQVLADLSNPELFKQSEDTLNKSDLLFIDGPKDGKFENSFLKNLTQLPPKKGQILIIDDIRFVNMIDVWEGISSPKLDLTSFGHWSGTGLVDISSGLSFW